MTFYILYDNTDKTFLTFYLSNPYYIHEGTEKHHFSKNTF
jgi:hypothetical protein